MMEAQRGFKIATFQSDGQQYLYELDAKGQNSLLRVYDSRTKLRSTQRIKLPANYLIYTCEQYLILVGASDILLYQVPNVNARLQCKNQSIKQIAHCCFNTAANLIFIIDDAGILYYLMPQLNSMTLKKLINLAEHNINGKVTRMCADFKSTIYILCADSSLLHSLKFDWNKADKLISHTLQNKINSIFCRFHWTAIISQNQSDHTLQIHRGTDYFKNNISYLPKNNSEIYKATNKDFVYIDPIKKTLITIAKGQQLSLYQFQSFIPQSANQSKLLFEIKSMNYNTVAVILHFFEGLRQPFRNVQIPIKWLQPQKQQQLLLYFHNNIHLVFGENGVSPHFSPKIRQFLQQNQQASDQILSCLFLQKLFKYAPLTVHKLCNCLLTQKNANMSIWERLPRFSLYINYSLNKIEQFLSSFHEKAQNANERFFDFLKSRYEQLQQELRCIINFTAKIQFQTATQMAQTEIRVVSLDQQNGRQIFKFAQTLQKSKTLYILNKIVYQQLSKKYVRSKQKHHFKISKASEISKGDQNNENSDVAFRQMIKVGKQTCHQFFNDNLKEEVTINEISKFLGSSYNFMQAAYFYLYLNPNQTQVPYISDGQTTELIRFLVQNPMPQVLSNREKLRGVIKQLPKMASKAFIVNEPSFLQYICSLSINCQQMRSCLAIFLSGVARRWAASTQEFVMQCYVLCDKALLAYSEVVETANSGEERKMEMQKLVSFCLERKKVKDLFELNFDVQDNEYVQQRLKIAFGDEGEEILQLMHELKIHHQ